MPKSFQLEDLSPERPDISFKGVKYLAALPGDFGLTVQAQLVRLERKMEELRPRITGPTADQGDVEATKMLDEVLNGIIQIYFPTLPMDIIEAIPQPKKNEIILFWGEECYPQALGRGRILLPLQVGPNPTSASSSQTSSSGTSPRGKSSSRPRVVS